MNRGIRKYGCIVVVCLVMLLFTGKHDSGCCSVLRVYAGADDKPAMSEALQTTAEDGESAKVQEYMDITENLLWQGGMLPEETGIESVAGKARTVRVRTVADYEGAREALCVAYDTFATSCDLTAYAIPKTELSGFVVEFLNTNPQYFYVNGGFYYSTDGDYVTAITHIEYNYEIAVAQHMRKELDEAVAVALAGADEDWSDMEKALYINDYLDRNCEYDTTYMNYSAYNVLVDKTAVCQGYAEAYLLLANALGLHCELVSSDSLNHAWNMVEIDGSYYMEDATWNDPVRDRLGRARHLYFMKSTAFYQTEEADHYEEDDWVITGGYAAADAADTAYDDSFWNAVDVGFDYVNGSWYGFLEESIYRYSCDGSVFKQEKSLVSIPDIWYSASGGYWVGKFVGTGSVGDGYYYSGKEAVYRLDVEKEQATVVYRLSEEEKTSGDIYGMHILPDGTMYILQAESPNVTGTKKQVLTLTKKEKQYTICFNGNGATAGMVDSMTGCLRGTCYTLPANAFVRTGYRFAGWNTKADGSGTDYRDEQRVSNLSAVDGGILTLYAQWEMLPPTEEPTTEAPKPSTEEPTTQAPKPPTEEPTTQAPKPPTEEPTTEAPKPPTEEPTTQAPKPPTEEPTTQAPKPPTEEPTTQAPKPPTTIESHPAVGMKVTTPAGTFRVTKRAGEEKEVAFISPKSAKKKTVTIPATVTIDGEVYEVTSIADKAFKNNKKLKTVTIGRNVKKIGKEAFFGCNKLKKITIKSKVLKYVGKNAVKNIHKKAVLKVPKVRFSKCKKLFAAKTGWKKTMKLKR